MKIGDQRFPNLVRKPSGFYWDPPRQAREAGFGSIPFGPELDARALERYAQAQRALARWRTDRAALAAAEKGPPAGSVDWLLAAYLAGNWFVERNEKTRQDYRNKLLALANFRLLDSRRFGEQMWREVEPLHTDALYSMFVRRQDGTLRPPYARAVMHQYRIVWNWAKRYLFREFQQNPFQGMRLEAPDPRRIKWEPWQVRRFIETAEATGMLSVAVAAAFCYELGQRPSDARSLTRGAFEGNRIRVVQQKTNRELLLPVSAALAAIVAKVPADQHQLVICERTGAPYEDYALSKAAASVRDAAALPSHLLLMDLRRTCLSELGDLGATDDELISVSGHTQRQMLNVYSIRSYTRALGIMQRRWSERSPA